MIEAVPRPSGVFDIDAKRGADVDEYREYFNPDLTALYLHQETTPAYEPVPASFLMENGLNTRMRAVVVDWMYESSEELKLVRSPRRSPPRRRPTPPEPHRRGR